MKLLLSLSIVLLLAALDLSAQCSCDPANTFGGSGTWSPSGNTNLATNTDYCVESDLTLNGELVMTDGANLCVSNGASFEIQNNKISFTGGAAADNIIIVDDNSTLTVANQVDVNGNVIIDVRTGAEINFNASLNYGSSVTRFRNNGGTVNIGGNFSMNGSSDYINCGTISIGNGITLANGSQVFNNGSFTVSGGDVQNTTGGTIKNTGNFFASGANNYSSGGTSEFINEGLFEIKQLNINGGSLTGYQDASVGPLDTVGIIVVTNNGNFNSGTVDGDLDLCKPNGTNTTVWNGSPSGDASSKCCLNTSSCVAAPTSGAECEDDSFPILDIELSYFDVSYNATLNLVEFNWETLTETNNEVFVIQLLQNGIYTDVATIDGSGTTTESVSYSYDMEFPAGSYTFRLKQIDFDGAESTSALTNVTFGSNSSSITVIPNPVVGQGSIQVSNTAYLEEADVRIFGSNGALVEQISVGDVSPGVTNIELPYLVEGIYAAQIIDINGFAESVTFVVR